MKKSIAVFICIATIALSLSACGWKPSVPAVAITAPWDKMNLPVKENAVVWASSDKEFKAVHKDDKKTVLAKYTDALKADGWTLVKFDDKTIPDRFTVEMSKGAEKIEVEIYDFENTGVIIEKK